MVFSLSPARFFQLAELLVQRREEEVQEGYILQAFGAWLQGAGQKKTFKQYIRHLGLEQKEKREAVDTKAIVRQNVANAQKILELDRQQRQAKEGKVSQYGDGSL